MQPTVLPAVVEETYITSNAIDLSGQKTVSVRSFTDSAAGTLDNIADGISETYWMSNDSNDAVKRLEFHFQVIFIGSNEIKDVFLGSSSFLQFVDSEIKQCWTRQVHKRLFDYQ